MEKQQLFEENFLKFRRGPGRSGPVLLWAAAALLTGLVLVWYALDPGAGAPVFTPLEPGLRLAEGPPLDLNSASTQELEDLPGLGPALAERIAAWREEHGPFAAPEDVTEVSGIGPAIYEGIAPYIGTEQEGTP